MNFLQLVQDARLECGISGSGPTTVVGQTGEMGRLTNWVSGAWTRIQLLHTDWKFLRKSVSFSTVAGQPTYSPLQCGAIDTNNAVDLSAWARHTFRNYVTPTLYTSATSLTIAAGVQSLTTQTGKSIGAGATIMLSSTLSPTSNYMVGTVTSYDTSTGALVANINYVIGSGTIGVWTIMTPVTGFNSEVFMDYIDYDSWRDNYMFGALRSVQTRPLEISVTPNKSIALGPFPIDGYTIVGDYFSKPFALSLDADTPSCPDQFHLLLVYAAIMSYGAYEGATEVYQRGEMLYNELLSDLVIDQLPDINGGGALA